MNYFNYFTEIEERFQQRRGSLLMLSTLDWALIETWREAGVPLEAVLRGIDDAFDQHERKLARSKGRTRRINGLAWAAQSVMQATEAAAEASVGVRRGESREARESGFESERILIYLEHNATAIEGTGLAPAIALRLRELASSLRSDTSLRPAASPSESTTAMPNLEDLDRTLTVLEEKMFATLLTSASEEELFALREQATRELAPYRGKMQAVQIKQVQQQFLQNRLLEARGLPRLSLFYMSHD